MADIKTALSGILSEWELDNQQQEKQVETKPYFSVTNNVTRATFEYIKANPASSFREVSKALEKRGYKPSSVGSLLTQFLKKGMCTRDAQNRYSVAVPEYMPMKANKKIKANQVIQKAKVTRGEGIAALSPQPTYVTVADWNVQAVLDNMSIMQARAVYDALKKIFGG
jgi:predicted transcriptional regulator